MVNYFGRPRPMGISVDNGHKLVGAMGGGGDHQIFTLCWFSYNCFLRQIVSLLQVPCLSRKKSILQIGEHRLIFESSARIFVPFGENKSQWSHKFSGGMHVLFQCRLGINFSHLSARIVRSAGCAPVGLGPAVWTPWQPQSDRWSRSIGGTAWLPLALLHNNNLFGGK